MSHYSIGLDFGTNSCRALLVDLESGNEVSSEVYDYTSGENGIFTDPRDPNIARQDPLDYSRGITKTIKGVIAKAKESERDFDPKNIIGIGVDATSSSPLFIDQYCSPLSFNPEFADNLNAMVWLWKDHTSHLESIKITETARSYRPEYLSNIGQAYSAEWFWSKLLHCKNTDPLVFRSSESFVEVCDYIPALLTGVKDPKSIKHSVCTAGHKTMFNEEWGGLPDAEFFNLIDPELNDYRKRLYTETYVPGQIAGSLSKQWSEILGLSPETKVAVGIIDAHSGAIGSGVKEGTLVQITGTSTCHILVSPLDRPLKSIAGISGIVKDSVIPGYFGIEAGQPATGDIFLWFVKQLVPDIYGSGIEEKFRNLGLESLKLKPGESGLLALDWNNGNRSILMDFRLSGLLIGQTLQTKAHEIYRTLIESTAFGALKIINRFEDSGIMVNDVVCCGGLAQRNPLLLQIYSDIIGREIKLAQSSQTGALGAAILGAVAAGHEKGGFRTIEEAQKALCRFSEVYSPSPDNLVIYGQLYQLYCRLHDAFGRQEPSGTLFNIMKELIAIREEQRKG